MHTPHAAGRKGARPCRRDVLQWIWSGV